jgi:hypothetical protein
MKYDYFMAASKTYIGSTALQESCVKTGKPVEVPEATKAGRPV